MMTAYKISGCHCDPQTDAEVCSGKVQSLWLPHSLPQKKHHRSLFWHQINYLLWIMHPKRSTAITFGNIYFLRMNISLMVMKTC